MASGLSAQRGDGFWRFVVLGFLVSLVAHALLFFWAGWWVPPRFGEVYYEQIVPRKFRLERVEIDPQLLKEEKETPAREQMVEVKPVELPPERVVLQHQQETGSTPEALRVSDFLAQEQAQPSDELGKGLASALENAQGGSLLAEDLEALRQELLAGDVGSSAQPVLDLGVLSAGQADGQGAASGGYLPGYSDLDELLSRTGRIEATEGPIFMPGDLLFDYDSAEVRPEAVEVLRKLGTLMIRHQNLRFRIEGHTDSFGTPEYNQGLSERRALAVKDWLVREMGIPPERMTTVGYGSTRLVVPAAETIEGQQLNRRVEIALEKAEPEQP